MPLTDAQIRDYLTAFDFRYLFNGLGWDNNSAKHSVSVDGQDYLLTGVASKKRGMAVFLCETDTIPPYATRRAIDRAVTKTFYEHILIFIDAPRTTQVWQWVKREAGRPDAARERTFTPGQQADALIQRLRALTFTLDEEESLTMARVTGRVARALDVETVTKRFYDEFKKQHTAFLATIEGIPDGEERDWYASLMLNRLMFVYFIQSKRLLDGDPDYLRNRLRATRERLGPDQFYGFYREFLLKLFHDGLNAKRPHAPEVVALIGDVPYLNGGLFAVHDIEESHAIEIPDSAFAAVFDFFGQWDWHLDTRPTRAGDEINPDVLGYIFEKYINQKEMGAYYTKEDITEYIGKNTIVPFLFDAAKRANTIAFAADGAVWSLLRENPDKYIYDAVKKGVERPLPPEIAAGIHDVTKRDGWNKPVGDDAIALPTETWRELVARRQRYEEVWTRLVDGGVTEINDLITLNLNIRQFAQDVIDNCESTDLLNALWRAITTVTVLDPTCGSGAFLFAALNILAPLYDACLERMQAFVDAPGSLIGAGTRDRYTRILDAYKERDRAYAILKSIIVNNLYGVDIMEEAVEICKLRLFLTLAAHLGDGMAIEPLPDIDFNIRAGNTLVGYATGAEVERATMKGQQQTLDLDGTYARIREQAEIAARAWAKFQEQQAVYDNRMDAADKEELRAKLAALRDELDRYLAAEYGIDRLRISNAEEYARRFAAWQQSHKPFHWWSESYGIIDRGGFDVIIGNPPYVEYSKVRNVYVVSKYCTEESGNLYAFVLERCLNLQAPSSYCGMIVPTAIACTDRMLSIRSFIETNASNLHVSHFAIRPSKLFDGVDQRVSIVLYRKAVGDNDIRVTRYNKWSSQERPIVFSLLSYATSPSVRKNVWCKTGNMLVSSIVRKIERQENFLHELLDPKGQYVTYYKNTGVNHWLCVTTHAPKFYRDGQLSASSRETHLLSRSRASSDALFCILNSSTYFLQYQQLTNCRDFNPSDIRNFPIPSSILCHDFTDVASRLAEDLELHSDYVVREQSQTGRIRLQFFRPRYSKPIIDEIDHVLAQHYGFTDEELDFIINYDIKYRMGQDEA